LLFSFIIFVAVSSSVVTTTVSSSAAATAATATTGDVAPIMSDTVVAVVEASMTFS